MPEAPAPKPSKLASFTNKLCKILACLCAGCVVGWTEAGAQAYEVRANQLSCEARLDSLERALKEYEEALELIGQMYETSIEAVTQIYQTALSADTATDSLIAQFYKQQIGSLTEQLEAERHRADSLENLINYSGKDLKISKQGKIKFEDYVEFTGNHIDELASGFALLYECIFFENSTITQEEYWKLAECCMEAIFDIETAYSSVDNFLNSGGRRPIGNKCRR